MTNNQMTPLELAHARAVEVLLGNIPKLKETDANEIVESITALVFETLKLYAEEEHATHNH